MIFWLTNSRTDRWRDKTEVKVKDGDLAARLERAYQGEKAEGMIRAKEVAPVTNSQPVAKEIVMKGPPRIYVTAADRQSAYRARTKAACDGAK